MTDNNHTEKDIDKVSGVETTGHEWDGIKELNTPAPRWWLWVFYACVIWSIGYYIFYPSWPTPSGHTKGRLGTTQIQELAKSQAEINLRQVKYLDKFQHASFDDILNNPELYEFAKAGGAAAFKNNCSTCHGTGGAGAKGYPNLNDDDWLWGGTVADIYQTIRYGIRSNHENTRVSQMPSFGRDGLLKADEINDVVDYVLSLSGGEKNAQSTKGQTIFASQCVACHGDDGKGGRSVGAPNLTDKIWLYGGDKTSVHNSLLIAHAGVMPAWVEKLDDNTIRQLTIYVHELGGGEKDAPSATMADIQKNKK